MHEGEVLAVRKTNSEFLDELMSFSDHGALMQAFVIEGLRLYANQVVAADLSSMKNGFILPEAWKGCAEEYLTAWRNNYGQ